MMSVNFLKLKRPFFGNMYVHRGIINLTCIVAVVDSPCVWVCASGGGGWLVVHYEL